MTRSILFLLCALTLAAGAMGVSDDDAEARKTALDLAGAFSNDGFKIRDGNWTGTIHPKDALLIQVHLYAGNQYWFTVGASGKAKKLSVSVFDETGALVQSDAYEDAGKTGEGPKAAAGFAPSISGPYYVRIKETEGDAASFSFIYSYK